MTVSLADLVTPSTQPEALAASLAICTALGLPTTAWQPIQAIPTVMATNAQIAADASTIRARIAQGGYPSYAAQMVDGNGVEVTSWMDLIAKEFYNVTRNSATPATGPVPLSNTGGTSYPFTPANPLRFQNPVSGATYATTGTGSVLASSVTSVSVSADAAYVGTRGITGAGAVLTMLTPLAHVTALPLVTSLVGNGQESNAALLARGQGKIANISPNGPTQAYDYVAQSIPVGTPSAVAPYAVSSQITRSTAYSNPGSGTVQFTVANAAGPPTSADLAVVSAAIQNQVVPMSVLATVQAATAFSLTLGFIVAVKASAGLTATQIITNIEAVLANFVASVPIGGFNAHAVGYNNYIPYNDIVALILFSNGGTVDVALAPFAGCGGGYGQLAVTDVPVLAPPVVSVSFI